MGNRDDLLAGAKRCLYEKGYARITARDIASAANTSLAAIGYHFGSVEALLNEAAILAIDEFGDGLRAALQSPAVDGQDRFQRFEAIWERILGSFEEHRPLWVASFEIVMQAERSPEVKRVLAKAMEDAREGLAEIFHGIAPQTGGEEAHALGSLYHALMSGVLAQWLVDPARAPTSRQLVDALRIVAGAEPKKKKPSKKKKTKT